MTSQCLCMSVLVAFALASCTHFKTLVRVPVARPASVADPYNAAHHLIIVDRSGMPMKPSWRWKGIHQYAVEAVPFEGKTIEDQNNAYERYLNEMTSAIRASGKKKVLIYIHGGMNRLSGSVQTAGATLAKFSDRASGYDLDADTYPLFVCWDSPFWGYGEQALWVRAGKTEQHSRAFGGFGNIYSWLSMPLHVVADVGRAVTSFPAELTEFGYNDFHAARPEVFSEHKLMLDEIKRLREDKNNGHPQITVGSVPEKPEGSFWRRLPENASLVGLYPVRNATLPLLDAVGVRAWDNMLRHTETMFDRTRTHRLAKRAPGDTSDLKGVEKRETEDYYGAMAMFMNALKNAVNSSAQITLVGHSLGAIICNRIIVDYPSLDYRNIVYMGAACSVREFEASVVPYLSQHSCASFYNLCLDPQRESGEVAFAPGGVSLPIASRGSLLVWIDNIYGRPPSEKQRRFGIYQTAVVSNGSIPTNVRTRITFKPFKYDGESSQNGLILNPRHHGDFSSAPYWRSSFWSVKDS